MVQPRFKGNEYRTTTLCVDSYENGVLAGRIYHPSCDGIPFKSLSQFLVQMEDLLDELKLPQSFTAARSFAPLVGEVEGGRLDDEAPKEGKLATFAIRILFRQNASWQGSVAWIETGQESTFRSTLELIFLTDSALREVRVN